MGKGSKKRPSQVTPEEEELRWQYMTTDMSREEFDKQFNELKKQGLIKRSGKVVI